MKKKKKSKCDCHKHERQVCDICQGVSKGMTPTGKTYKSVGAMVKDLAGKKFYKEFAKAKKKAEDPTKDFHPVHKAVSDVLAEGEETARICDGFADALVGVTLSQFDRNTVLVYDYEKVIRILQRGSKPRMSREDAEEYFDYNIIGGWHGKETPMFIHVTKDFLERHGHADLLSKKKRIPANDPRQLQLL